MNSIELTKTNAIKAVGSTVFDANYGDVKPGFTGELVLLLHGAKLTVKDAHNGRRTRFWVTGYAADGSDLAPYAHLARKRKVK